MAAAWAVMAHLGVDGYLERTGIVLETADRMRAAIAATDGARVLGDGSYHVIAMAADPAADHPLDVFALGDALLGAGGTTTARRRPTPCIRRSATATPRSSTTTSAIWPTASARVRGQRTADRSTGYATLE